MFVDQESMPRMDNYPIAFVLEIIYLTRFNKITIQGTHQVTVDKEAINLSRVYSYYSKCNMPLLYVQLAINTTSMYTLC